MKKNKKVLAAFLAAILLLLPLASSAHAASLIGGLFEEDGPLGGLVDMFSELLGGNTPGGNAKLSDLFSNPGGVLDTIRQRIGKQVDDQTLIEAISELLGNTGQSFNLEDLLSNDFLNRLRKYLGMAEVTEESTTAPEPVTDPNSTAPTAPIYTMPPTTYYYYYYPTSAYYVPQTNPPTTVYSGAQPYPGVSASTPQDEYIYTQPSTEYVAPITTQNYSVFNVTEENREPDVEDEPTWKLWVGVTILVLSMVAVVVVAVILRKSKV